MNPSSARSTSAMRLGAPTDALDLGVAGETDPPVEGIRAPHLDLALALAFFAGGLGLYVLTLAPTITWGDDATLTLVALKGELHASAGSHPVWVALAHLLSRLPLGEPAYRVNLASALSGAITLALMYLVFRQLRISQLAAGAGVLALAVSHTFWAHAVRAEIYTTTLAALAFMMLTALLWWRTGRVRYLALTGLAFGLGMTTHVITLLYLPGVAWLILQRGLRRRAGAVLLVSTLAALAPLALLLWRDNQSLQTNLWGLARWALFTFEGYDFADRMFRFSAASFLSDAVTGAGYLVYQFVGIGLICIPAGLWTSRRWPRALSLFVGLLFAVSTLFAFAYNVGDRYVFYLPSYLPIAVWLALGFETLVPWLQRRLLAPQHRQALLAALLLLIVAVPVAAYRSAPILLAWSGRQVRDARYVPGPNSRLFLLWPPKTGYDDARVYATSVLAHAPQNAVILADPILASPIDYLVQAEGLRSDVTIRFCCWDIDNVIAQFPDRPIVLADNAPDIYPTARLEHEYKILPQGPLYRLMPLP